MIEKLIIKNVALIESAEVSFGAGLNILSGETGAGKSMLIDAISFVLGERVDKDFIRNGAASAEVDALFGVSRPETSAALAELGVKDCEQLLLSRTINTGGRSGCKVNGKTVTISMLKEISSFLIDMHGQHEHQSLLNADKHIALLDKFCEAELGPLKAALAEQIARYKELLKTMRLYIVDDKERESKISLLLYQKNEIESAMLKHGEEEKLDERRKKLANLEKLTESVYQSLELLSEAAHGQQSAYEQISGALNHIKHLSGIDESKKYMSEMIETIQAELNEVIHDLKLYSENLDADPDELNKTDARLDLIHSLKKKYGGSIGAILKRRDEISAQLEAIENSKDTLQALSVDKKKFLLKILTICENISAVRKKHAVDITSKIISVLQELGMKDATFEIVVTRKKEFGLNGFDAVEFLISPNPGEPLKPLAKIASGGEMSRVMLSLKTVLADSDSIETFIFDEIDAGVSGRTAQQVAEKLNILGKSHQILCITHLPQIAAMADSHYLIEKRQNDNKTTSHISELTVDSAISELARLLGGARITDATVNAAREMKQMAQHIQNR